MDLQTTCPQCRGNITPMDYFCPVCGKKLKEKPLSTTILKQLSIYLISVFLPPLGLWPAVKYIRQSDEKSKRIGWTAVMLTVISILVTVWMTMKLINSFNKQLNSQLDLYSGMGF
jgi:uncharacterized membrane protein YvbJ